MSDENPFYRSHFWYQCAMIEFRLFREKAESLANDAIKTIPRAAPLIRAQSFFAKSFDELSVQFSFGKHPTGRFYIDESGKQLTAAEDGASLVYSIGPNGAVAIFLQPAYSNLMKANERFILRHIGPLSAHQLRSRLRSDLKDLVAYNYFTALDGRPTLHQSVRIRWLTLVSLVELRGEQYIPMKKVFFGGIGFLARVSVTALLKPWGLLAMIVIASYFGFDVAHIRNALGIGGPAPN